MVDVRNGHGVPGVACQGACAETVLVMYKMADDHFDDLQRQVKLGMIRGRGPRAPRSLWGTRTTRTYSPDDSGSRSVPKPLGEGLGLCGRDTVGQRGNGWWELELPDNEDVGISVGAIEVVVSGGCQATRKYVAGVNLNSSLVFSVAV